MKNISLEEFSKLPAENSRNRINWLKVEGALQSGIYLFDDLYAKVNAAEPVSKIWLKRVLKGANATANEVCKRIAESTEIRFADGNMVVRVK